MGMVGWVGVGLGGLSGLSNLNESMVGSSHLAASCLRGWHPHRLSKCSAGPVSPHLLVHVPMCPHVSPCTKTLACSWVPAGDSAQRPGPWFYLDGSAVLVASSKPSNTHCFHPNFALILISW